MIEKRDSFITTSKKGLECLCMANILQQIFKWFSFWNRLFVGRDRINFFLCVSLIQTMNWKFKSKWNAIILTSAILFNEGAAINTTYGVNSEVRRIFRAWGSTSKIAIFPSLWMRRMVSNLVPYIASSCVPITIKKIKQLRIIFGIWSSQNQSPSAMDNFHLFIWNVMSNSFRLNRKIHKLSTYHIPNIHWPQCQPSFRHVTRNSSYVRFLPLGVEHELCLSCW